MQDAAGAVVEDAEVRERRAVVVEIDRAAVIRNGRAGQAGAVRDTVEIIDVEDVPLQYYPGNTCRVKVKAAGDLA